MLIAGTPVCQAPVRGEPFPGNIARPFRAPPRKGKVQEHTRSPIRLARARVRESARWIRST